MTLYEQIISNYQSQGNGKNAEFEVMQQIILAGLHQAGFFDKAAFYGGTCLRIFHGLDRFSEDMDFSLLKEDNSFCFKDYFPALIDIFSAMGRTVSIDQKDKTKFSKIESAFLKDHTEVYDISFQTQKSMRIKMEVDTQPPLKFTTEQKLSLLPYSFMTRCFTLPDLFAGKMHALVFRNWRDRVKGRDWYDFEWYIRNNVKLNFNHLQERILQFNGKHISKEEFMRLLRERLASTDINMVKKDVIDFVANENSLNIWSNDYFLQLASMMKFE
jgi:predicted nucleotidyltransferase component of viral defense system